MDYTTFHIYHQYTLASPRRAEIIDRLEREKIGYKVYYPIPFHQQECFAELGYSADDLPVAHRLAQEVFSIPIFPELTADEQDEVVAAIRDALA
jgi:dTDP-4-amino-4,6-dideoxygalactose transaminase